MEETLRVGQLFLGKYRIEKLVGKGGMGAVYAAVDSDLARRVAVKVLLPHIASSRTAATRFVNEGRAAARIESEHVARVFSAGRTSQGLPYMILELLEGMDVSDLLQQRKMLGVEEAVDILIDALHAVGEAHRLGIVHRDLKPSNLFLHRRGNGSQVVKVLDFGISKLTQPMSTTSDHDSLTATQALLGTPNYMSPEQLLDAKSVGHRTDIWSLGVILYEMLAGTVPFGGASLRELFSAILQHQPMPLPQLRGDVPGELQMVIDRCITRDPQRRVGDALELARMLAPFGSGARAAALARMAMPTAPQMVLPAAAPSPPVHDAGGLRTVTSTNNQGTQTPFLPSKPHVESEWTRSTLANTTPSPVQMDSPWAAGYPPPGAMPQRPPSRSLLPYAIGVPLMGILAAGAIVIAARIVQTRGEAKPPTSAAAVIPPAVPSATGPVPSAASSASAFSAASPAQAPRPTAEAADAGAVPAVHPVPAAKAPSVDRAPRNTGTTTGTSRHATKRDSSFDPTKDSRF